MLFLQDFSLTLVVFYMKGDCSLLGVVGGGRRGTREKGGVWRGKPEGKGSI